MTLEEQLVQAICASNNEKVVELLKAGADPDHECRNPAKPETPRPVRVIKIALDYKNYFGCLHLLDHGAMRSLTTERREFLRESMWKLATNYFDQ